MMEGEEAATHTTLVYDDDDLMANAGPHETMLTGLDEMMMMMMRTMKRRPRCWVEQPDILA
jgi:hypothetical protein